VPLPSGALVHRPASLPTAYRDRSRAAAERERQKQQHASRNCLVFDPPTLVGSPTRLTELYSRLMLFSVVAADHNIVAKQVLDNSRPLEVQYDRTSTLSQCSI